MKGGNKTLKKINYKVAIINTVIIIAIAILFVCIKAQQDLNVNRKFLDKYSEIYKFTKMESSIDLGKEERKLESENRYSEALTLRGIQEFKNGSIENAKNILNLALENRTKKTYYISIFYTHKYLFEISKIEKNYDGVKTNLRQAIKSIPKKYYNENYYDIGELIKQTYDEQYTRDLGIEIFKDLISQKKYINKETQLYLRQRIRTIYILSNRYADATNSLINSINISKEIGDNYYLADSQISLAIILLELGGAESAVKLMEDAVENKIENVYQDADTKTFGYLNLAYAQFYYLNDFDHAMDTLSKLDQYRDNYTAEDFRDIEIYKLIYEADLYTMNGDLYLAKQNLDKIEELLKKEKHAKYLNKELEYKLAYARYFYAKGNYEEALMLYNVVVDEYRTNEEKNKLRHVLKEVIQLIKTMGREQEYHQYIGELLNLVDDIENFRYYDYSVYISTTIEEAELLEDSYDRNISILKVFFISIIVVLLFYINILKKIKNLKYSSEYDGLTNVYNRKMFDEKYRRLLKRKINFACIIMDIDNFKQINDTYGHSFGDIVLKNISKKIQSLLPKNCYLYRYGGEEFVIISKYTDKNESINLSEKLRKAVEEMVWKDDIIVTMSIGLAFSDIENESVLEVSDSNLYKAKKSGKNKVIY